MESKYPSALQSSANAQNLSLTIKGILLMLVPIAVTVARRYGYAWTENDVIEVIEGGWAAASAFVIAAGLTRKLAKKHISN